MTNGGAKAAKGVKTKQSPGTTGSKSGGLSFDWKPLMGGNNAE
jgi:hypothetical protein